MKSIAVYCGASLGADPVYADAARGLARALVDHLVATGFVRPAHAALMTLDADPDALIRRLRGA